MVALNILFNLGGVQFTAEYSLNRYLSFEIIQVYIVNVFLTINSEYSLFEMA